MKRILLLTLLCISSTLVMAQTWTGLGANTNWNTTDNWDTNLIPTSADDVIIPTGFTVTLNVAGIVKSIDVQGTSVFEMNTNLTFTEPSNFASNTTVNWNSGTLSGTGSTLTIQGELNLSTVGNNTVNGGTTINNQGTLNFTNGGDLFLNQDSVLFNTASGIIDMQADGGNISWNINPVGTVNNEGLIKKTTSSGEAQIITKLNNNDGTIQVEVGTLSFQNAANLKNFINGTYNVFTGATMDWDTTINPIGTLEGTVAGDINWNSIVNIPTGETVFLNFLGTDNFNWNGSLDGGGTLTNTNVLKIATSNATINGGSTLDNQGTLNFTGGGDLFINQDSVLNNPVGSVIDMQSDGGNISWNINPVGVLNNEGLIKKTTSSGEAQIITKLNNNDGTIQVEVGTLSFQNAANLKNFIDGTYNVFAGAIMDWDTTINPIGTLEGTVAGDINWNTIVNVPTGETVLLNFLGTDNFNWNGSLDGGGTLTNTNVLKIATSNATINGGSTLDNQGTLNFTDGGDLFINQDSVLNNPVGSIIDMQSDGGNISWNINPVGVLNNTGLIKKTTSIGEAQITTPLNNNDGTIQVEVGTLSFQNAANLKNFTDGTYNVFAGAIMDWDTTINPSGSLEGTIAGDLNWNTTVNVIEGTFAAFNFSETDNFNWKGILSGGGTLTNTNVINIASNNASINGNTTLENQGTINFTGGGDIFVNQESDFNNLANGVIDMQSDGGNISWNINPVGVFNNAGLIKRTTTTGIAQIYVPLNNSGTIEVISGELEHTGNFPFINEETGIVKGVGIFDLPTVANYTNNGTFAPGLSPGTLTVQGDFKSTTTSVLDIELNGLTPDTEHDVLAIIGNNNVFEGTVNAIMGFEGTIGDQFTIATTSGTIATANLQSPIENVDFDGKRYTFDVTYPDNNKVVLTITDKLDILPPNIITQNITVQLDATGNVSIADTDVDNGTTDNCTPTNELQFSLDITDFTCADLGDNVVTLTVTDNDGNSGDAQATVTVEDVTNPTIITQAITVQLDALGVASILASEIDNGSNDNCSIASMSLDSSDFSCADLGANTVELTVIDQSGNSDSAFATVTVEDAMIPTVLTQDITVQLDALGVASILASEIDNGSNDNCSIASMSLDSSDFSCADLGANTVNLTVIDESGNVDSASAIVTVVDTISPTALVQDVTLQLDATGNAFLFFSEIDNGSNDNCNFLYFSFVSNFTCADIGENSIEFTVTDLSGNSDSATAIVTIVDNISPTITCPAGFTVETTGDFILPDYFIEGDVTASDNCGFTVEQSPIPGTNLPDGDYTISYIVTDDAGNVETCSFNLKVDDITLGVDDYELSDQNIIVFPNPVINILTIKNTSQLQLTSLDIIDVAGKLVNTINLKPMHMSMQISLEDYANGMYFVRINALNSSITKRIIKQ